MEPKFIQVGSGEMFYVLDLNEIASVRFEGGLATVYMKHGYSPTFDGEDAQALRQFFRPINTGAQHGEAAPGVQRTSERTEG